MSSERDAHGGGQQAAREARSRLARVLRNGRGGRETEGRGGDRRNWSEQASESMAVLRGLNTVGALVTFLFLVFIFASAKGSKQKLQGYPNYPAPPAYQVSQSVPPDDRQPWSGENQQWEPQPMPMPNGPAPLPQPNPALQSQPWAVPSIAQQKQQAQAAFTGSQQPFAQAGAWQPGAAQDQAVGVPEQEQQAEECCPCTGEASQRGKGKGGDNLASAAATLGGLMWAGSHIPQTIDVWKTKDTSSFSVLFLFLQLGAAVLVFIYAALQQNALLAVFAVCNAACFGFYVWAYVKHPPGGGGGVGGAERSGLIFSEQEEEDDGL